MTRTLRCAVQTSDYAIADYLTTVSSMLEMLLPALIFWVSFTFTPGPFWVNWMSYHAQPNTLNAYRTYIIYLLTYFAGKAFLFCYLVQQSIMLDDSLLLPMYAVGSFVIMYIAVKNYRAQVQKKRLHFTYVKMVAISITNPKFYLSVPVGALSVVGATDSALMNSFLFAYVAMLPIVLSGSLLYYVLGKLSLKTARYTATIRQCSAALLFGYGVYLAAQGVMLFVAL